MQFNSAQPLKQQNSIESFSVDTSTTQKAEQKTGFEKTKDFCQKYIFSLPFTEESLGKSLEAKHHAFNVVFTSAIVVTFPISLAMCAARLTYVAMMEPKILANNLKLAKELMMTCRFNSKAWGITENELDDLQSRVDAAKDYDQKERGDLTDKPQIRFSNEVCDELKKIIIEKERDYLAVDLKNLHEFCVNRCLITKKSDGKYEVTDVLKNMGLSSTTRSILEGKKKISLGQERTAVEELRDILIKNGIKGIPPRPQGGVVVKESIESINKGRETSIQEDIGESRDNATKKTIIVSDNDSEPELIDEQKINSGQVGLNAAEEKFASSKSTGNAMKDFIKFGFGFGDKEVMIQNQPTKIRSQIDATAQTIARDLAFIYPKSKKGEAEFTDLLEAMNDAVKSNDIDQMKRVIDITIALCKSKLYRSSIKDDLAKGPAGSKLLKLRSAIAKASEENSELKPKFEVFQKKLTRVVNSTPANVKQSTREDKAKLQKNLNKVRSVDLVKKERKELVESLALDSKIIFTSFYQNMDVHDLAERTVDGTKVKGESVNDLIKFHNDMSFFVAEDILQGTDIEEVGRSVKFYISVALRAAENGDFMTAQAINNALNLSPIDRLFGNKTELSLSKKTKKNMIKLKTLFDPANSFKNVRDAQMRFTSGPVIPVLSVVLTDLTMLDENASEIHIPNGFNHEEEIVPNHFKISNQSKAIENINILSKSNIKLNGNKTGFNSIFEFKLIDKTDGKTPIKENVFLAALQERSRKVAPKSLNL